MRIVEPLTRREVTRFGVVAALPDDMAWSVSGKRLAVIDGASGSLATYAWRDSQLLAQAWREKNAWGDGPTPQHAQIFSGGGALLLRLWPDKGPDLVDTREGKSFARLDIGSRKAISAALDRTGDRIWLLFDDNTYSLWRRDPNNEEGPATLPPLAEDGLRLSPDGSALLARTQAGALWLAQLADDKNEPIAKPKLRAYDPTLVVIDAELDADGSRIFLGGADGIIRVRPTPWKADTAGAFDLTGHGAPVHKLSLSPDGTHLASASFDGRIRLTDLAEARWIARLPLADLPTGPRLAAMVPQLMARPAARCPAGLVPRAAFPEDFVCVTLQVRDETAEENRFAESRRSPTGGPYGPNTCLQGFVWREARADDLVCVTPESRARAKADSARATATRKPAAEKPSSKAP